jgi:hypothetical protein
MSNLTIQIKQWNVYLNDTETQGTWDLLVPYRIWAEETITNDKRHGKNTRWLSILTKKIMVFSQIAPKPDIRNLLMSKQFHCPLR